LKTKLINVTFKGSVRKSETARCASSSETSQLTLHRVRLGFYFKNYTHKINTLCRQNADFTVNPGGTYINHYVIKI